MSKKLVKRIRRVSAGAVVYLAAVLISLFFPYSEARAVSLELLVYLAAYFIIGGDVVRNAVKNLGNRRILDENFLMMTATAGAFLVGEYQEAVAVILF